MLPAYHEARKGLERHRLDLTSGRGERATTGVLDETPRAPAQRALVTRQREAATQQRAALGPIRKALGDPRGVEIVAPSDLVHRDRTRQREKMREDLASRRGLREGGSPKGRGHRVRNYKPVERGEISRQRFHEHEALVDAHDRLDADADRSSAREEIGDRIADHRLHAHALPQLLDGEITGAIQQQRQLVRGPRAPIRVGASPTREQLAERARQILLELTRRAEQVLEQRGIERQHRRGALGARRVVRVHPVHDEPELERERHRRRDLRLYAANRDASMLDLAQYLAQRREVERVLQDVAIRLDENREGRELPHRLEQVLRLETLEPERHSASWIAARQEQRARCVHAEARTEQRRVTDLG